MALSNSGSEGRNLNELLENKKEKLESSYSINKDMRNELSNTNNTRK